MADCLRSMSKDVIVDAFYGSTHERIGSCGTRKSSMQLSCMERSDRSKGPVRPVAGENRRRPTNTNSGGTPSG